MASFSSSAFTAAGLDDIGPGTQPRQRRPAETGIREQQQVPLLPTPRGKKVLHPRPRLRAGLRPRRGHVLAGQPELTAQVLPQARSASIAPLHRQLEIFT
ncbi:hypothetical protein Are01nite_89550 [Actinoplanes regularis]|nr:hypothetical protein Are01nite_89550 [Actinoplanes regularis]